MHSLRSLELSFNEEHSLRRRAAENVRRWLAVFLGMIKTRNVSPTESDAHHGPSFAPRTLEK
jgi:hypothetical protein